MSYAYCPQLPLDTKNKLCFGASETEPIAHSFVSESGLCGDWKFIVKLETERQNSLKVTGTA